MKLCVAIKFEIGEEALREALHTESAEQTAIVLKSILMQSADDYIDEMGAENISISVYVVDE